MKTIKKKMFVIGLPKTCLTSVLFACRYLDLNAHGTNKPALKAYFRDDLVTIYDYFNNHDVLVDWPVPLMYKQAFRHYGADALYVLTLRRSADAWVDSLKRHSLLTNPLKTWYPKLFGYRWPHGFEDLFKAFYQSYTEDAVRFFAENDASDQLLTFCAETGDSWPQLCDFIGCNPPPEIPFPKKNISVERDMRRFRLAYNTVASSVYGCIAPKVLRNRPIVLP